MYTSAKKEISKGKKEEIYEAADASDSHRKRNYVKRNDLHFVHFTAARTMSNIKYTQHLSRHISGKCARHATADIIRRFGEPFPFFYFYYI